MNDCRSCLLFSSASRPPSSLSEGCFQASGWRWIVAVLFAVRLASDSFLDGTCAFAPSGNCLCALSAAMETLFRLRSSLTNVGVLWWSRLSRSFGIRSVVPSLRRLCLYCILSLIPCIHIYLGFALAVVLQSPDRQMRAHRKNGPPPAGRQG